MSYSYRSTKSSSVASRFTRNRNNGQRKTGRGGGRSQNIHPSRFIKPATASTAEVHVPQYQFEDFELNGILKLNLKTNGYVTPSPIQDETIPAGLQGKDLIGIASTGTGKTAAFVLPVLQKLMDDKSSAAIIIAPTRELAQQIEEECRKLGKGSGLFSALLIGGSSMGLQLRDLRSRPRVIIGTPGRIKDHLERRTLNLQNFNIVVLDEVDRMLDMGFVSDVTEILSHMAEQTQSFFFSATIDERVRVLINKFTNDPYTVSIKASAASEHVHQDIVEYRGNMEKIEKLHDLLLSEKVSKAIVFDETQRSVERLNQELVSRGFSADAIHGGKSQGQRQRALSKFKKNDIKILVATDVAARGIDVADISHVVNYSVPKMYDDYIHRVGRAGRAGRAGYALTFVSK